MQNHLQHLYNTAVNVTYSLCKIRKFIDKKTAVILFKAYVLSRLEYGSLLCLGANRIYFDRLQKLMNLCLRNCLGKRYDANVYQMHIEAKVLPLNVRLNIALLKLMYSTLADSTHEQTNNLQTTYDTRSARVKNFIISRPRTESYKKSVIYQGKKRWLELPVSLKNVDYVEEFGKNMKTHCTEEFVLSGIV